MQELMVKIFFLQDQLDEDTIIFKIHLLLIVSNIPMNYKIGSTNSTL